jgi:integrating conjugative element protein (TIGR03756 family)
MAFPALAVNTAQIIASSLSPDCLHYRIVGICYWLQCTPFGCTVRTSVKVRHNIPELVVSVYAVPGHNPWQEVAFFGAAIPGIAEQGGDTNPREGNPKTKIRFKNADAIGHPGGETFYRFLSGFGYSATARQCRSSLTLSARWMPPPGVPAFPRAFFPKP